MGHVTENLTFRYVWINFVDEINRDSLAVPAYLDQLLATSPMVLFISMCDAHNSQLNPSKNIESAYFSKDGKSGNLLVGLSAFKYRLVVSWRP